jgi:hypothetical protein
LGTGEFPARRFGCAEAKFRDTGFPGAQSENVCAAWVGGMREYLWREELWMRKLFGTFALVGLAPVLVAGCEGEVRYYDAGFGDYHTWNHGEVVYNNNWEHETHRNMWILRSGMMRRRRSIIRGGIVRAGINTVSIRGMESKAKIEKGKWKIEAVI